MNHIMKSKKRVVSLILSVFMMLALIAVPVSDAKAEEKEYAGKTVILHTNDVHGAISGYEKVAALRKEYQEKGADVLLVDAGDFSQGTPYVSSSKGLAAVELMNASGYDVAGLGNHEFDYSYEQLAENLKQADFKVICSNILKDGNPIYAPYYLKDTGTLKIGFFAVDTPETMTKTNPAMIQGLTFLTKDTAPTIWENAQIQVAALKNEGADIVICLSHMGTDTSSAPYLSYDLYKNVSGIDFVIDAHSHSVMTGGSNGEPIQSTGTAFEKVGVIIIDNALKEIESNTLINTEDISGADETVKALADSIIEDVDDAYGTVFARSEVVLNGEKSPGNRTQETNNGDLIADAMKWFAGKESGSISVPAENVVAITNGGGIRHAIDIGNVTKNDINAVLPFGNTVAVVYVTGAELLAALEASTFDTPAALGSFPQIAGMEIQIDTGRKYDAESETYPDSTYYGPRSINRVTVKTVNGKPFDTEATYAVVTTNFCAAGGDTYYAFAASSQFDTGAPLDEVVMEYITVVLKGVIGTEYANPKGRITILTEPYTLQNVSQLFRWWNGKYELANDTLTRLDANHDNVTDIKDAALLYKEITGQAA